MNQKHMHEEDTDMFDTTADPEISQEIEMFGMDPLEILIALEEANTPAIPVSKAKKALRTYEMALSFGFDHQTAMTIARND